MSITRHEAAHYVLHECGEPGWWLPPGGFYQKLIAAAMHADSDNLVRIGLGFPSLAWAVRTYKSVGPAPLFDKITETESEPER